MTVYARGRFGQPDHMATSIHVVTSDPSLRRALTARLERSPGLVLSGDDGVASPFQTADIVVTPASDCEPEHCARLARSGVKVIVLAAIPREREKEQYLAAGAAAYVPMAVDLDQLLSEIHGAMERPERGGALLQHCNGRNGNSANATGTW